MAGGAALGKTAMRAAVTRQLQQAGFHGVSARALDLLCEATAHHITTMGKSLRALVDTHGRRTSSAKIVQVRGGGESCL